jgi:hypothetical protein
MLGRIPLIRCRMGVVQTVVSKEFYRVEWSNGDHKQDQFVCISKC